MVEWFESGFLVRFFSFCHALLSLGRSGAMSTLVPHLPHGMIDPLTPSALPKGHIDDYEYDIHFGLFISIQKKGFLYIPKISGKHSILYLWKTSIG